MKYDIGIQTFWNVPNYGTYAQAYALQKVLQELNGDKDVRQISHLDQHHFNFYFNSNFCCVCTKTDNSARLS